MGAIKTPGLPAWVLSKLRPVRFDRFLILAYSRPSNLKARDAWLSVWFAFGGFALFLFVCLFVLFLFLFCFVSFFVCFFVCFFLLLWTFHLFVSVS